MKGYKIREYKYILNSREEIWINQKQHNFLNDGGTLLLKNKSVTIKRNKFTGDRRLRKT